MNRSTLALRQTLRLGNTVIGGKTKSKTTTNAAACSSKTLAFNLHQNAKILSNISMSSPIASTPCNISSLREFSSNSATVESDARALARDEHLLTKTKVKDINRTIGSDSDGSDNNERKPTRLRDVSCLVLYSFVEPK